MSLLDPFAPEPKQSTPAQLVAQLIANGGSPYMFAAGLPEATWKQSGADSHLFSRFVRRNTPVPIALPPGYVFESAIPMGSPAVSGIDSRGYRNPRGSKFASQWGGGLSGLGQVSDTTASQLLASVPNLAPPAGSPGTSSGVLNYLPIGTQLVYTASISPGWTGPLTSLADIVASVAANVNLNAGIQIIGNNASTNPFTSQSGFSLTLQLKQQYTNAGMVQSVLDSAVNATSVSLVSSSIQVTNVPQSAQVSQSAGAGTVPVGAVPTSAGGSASNPNPNPNPNEFLTWIETYGGWVVACVAGVVVVKMIFFK